MFPYFHYVGPAHIRRAAAEASSGRVIERREDLRAWLREDAQHLAAEDGWSTYVVQQFTFRAIFRRCPECQQRNLVKDDWFYCELCDTELPAAWNFQSSSTEC